MIERESLGRHEGSKCPGEQSDPGPEASGNGKHNEGDNGQCEADHQDLLHFREGVHFLKEHAISLGCNDLSHCDDEE